MRIKIKKQRQNIIYIQLMLVCIMEFLISTFNITTGIRYLTDIILLCSIMFCFGKFTKTFRQVGMTSIIIVLCLMFVSSIISMIYNRSSLLLYLWGFRNNARIYLFFICCVVLLREKDIDLICKILSKLFWINLIIIMYQFYFMGVRGDLAGGIFGNISGCNSYVNIFIGIVCAYIVSQYAYGKKNIWQMFIYVLSSVYVASIAELKVFYIELIIMFLVLIVVKKPSKKTVFLILCSACTCVLGIAFLKQYSEQSIEVLFEEESRNDYLSGEGYTGQGDLNRFTAIDTIDEMFFKDNKKQRMLGFGLGNCDTSRFYFLKSDFYEKYEYLHYRWFTHAWTYLEQGKIGLTMCFLFYTFIFLWLIRNKRYIIRTDIWIMEVMFVPICFISIIYNNLLQMEGCYLVSMMCASALVLPKNSRLAQYS